ncbi:hypothetical protein V8C43DRAFT_25674 [Trichoderma afarasin]
MAISKCPLHRCGGHLVPSHVEKIVSCVTGRRDIALRALPRLVELETQALQRVRTNLQDPQQSFSQVIFVGYQDVLFGAWRSIAIKCCLPAAARDSALLRHYLSFRHDVWFRLEGARCCVTWADIAQGGRPRRECEAAIVSVHSVFHHISFTAIQRWWDGFGFDWTVQASVLSLQQHSEPLALRPTPPTIRSSSCLLDSYGELGSQALAHLPAGSWS